MRNFRHSFFPVLLVVLLLALVVVGPVGAGTTVVINAAVDGYARELTDSDWPTMRDAAGDLASTTDTTVPAILLQASSTTDEYTSNTHAILSFNTSTLGSGAVVESAVLSVRGLAAANPLGDFSVNIFGGVLADNASIASGDYNGWTATPYSSEVPFGSLPAGRLNFTLNTDGKSAIDPTGFTVFYMLHSFDYNVSQSPTWASGAEDTYSFRATEHATESNRPYLEIVYSLVGAPVSAFTTNVSSGMVSLPVEFTDASTNTPTSWNWSFGDGTYSEDQNPGHTYTKSNGYTVSLTATNAAGSDIATAIITVSDPPYIDLDDYASNKTYYVIGSPDGALNNYQVNFTLYNTTGTDSGRAVYLGTGIQVDFDDVIFTDANDVIIPHGYLSFTDESADAWVRVPAIPSGCTNHAELHIYYENATVDGHDHLTDVFPGFSLWDAENDPPSAADVNISEGATNYEAWPDITKNESGTLWITYRTSDTNTHLFDATGRVVIRRSDDDGATWGDEVNVSDVADVDDRNPAILNYEYMGEETLIVAYNTYVDGHSRLFVNKSTDGGTTWGDAASLSTGQERRTGGTHIIQTTRGRVAFTSYDVDSDVTYYEESSDGGTTWTEYQITNIIGDESSVIETRSDGEYTGGIYATIRNHDAPYDSFISRSDDFGHTWGVVTNGTEPSPLISTPAAIDRAPDDHLLLGFTDNSELVMYESYDEGENWELKSVINSGSSPRYYQNTEWINETSFITVWCNNNGASDVSANFGAYPLLETWAISEAPSTSDWISTRSTTEHEPIVSESDYIFCANTGPTIFNWYCPAGRFCLGPFILWEPAQMVMAAG